MGIEASYQQPIPTHSQVSEPLLKWILHKVKSLEYKEYYGSSPHLTSWEAISHKITGYNEYLLLL